MGIENYGDDELLEAMANRGIDVRHITEYSMTEINNEITRRRMEAERAEVAWEEHKVEIYLNQIKSEIRDGQASPL